MQVIKKTCGTDGTVMTQFITHYSSSLIYYLGSLLTLEPYDRANLTCGTLIRSFDEKQTKQKTTYHFILTNVDQPVHY